MNGMFGGARSFNCDISRWDVSRVTEMSNMFNGATTFEHELCGIAWINSKAIQLHMFVSSGGSISSTQCVFSPQPRPGLKSPFLPQSRSGLKSANLPQPKKLGLKSPFLPQPKRIGFKSAILPQPKKLGFKGAINAQTVCSPAQGIRRGTVFSPRRYYELKNAVDACLKECPKGDCSDGPYGSIGKWDVSSIADMKNVFAST